MVATRTLPIPAEHRELTVKSNGQVVGREQHLLSCSILKMVNRISSACLIYQDGEAASANFPLSSSDTFLPGKEIEILGGTGADAASLFKGVVVKQSLKIRDHAAPRLVIECRHKAFKLTVGRKSAYYLGQKDSELIGELLEHAGIDGSAAPTAVKHEQQVQYLSSDWDFILLRARANGQWILTNDDKVTVKKPDASAAPVCALQFGATILELDAEIDARRQFSAVKSLSWDPASQAVSEKEAVDPAFQAPGDLASGTLAQVSGLSHYPLVHGALAADEAQAWADAEWLRAQLSKTCGRVKCEGIGTVNPGDTVTLGGVGPRYNGKALVTGVRHELDTVHGWKTHIQFGGADPRLEDHDEDVNAPKASSLLPGVSGMQIGVVVSNEDPDGEHRVQVRMPLVDPDSNGTWARVAALDAGKDRGFFVRPDVGDEVVLGFIQDDPRRPVVLGMLHSSAHAAPLQGSDDNQEKLFQTRSKMKLYFNDEKKVLRLETPAGNKLTLSEEDQGIELADQNGNKIKLGPSGISIESATALTLKAGTELSLESGTSFSAKGGTEAKIEGAAGAELSSTAITKVKGSLIQLN